MEGYLVQNLKRADGSDLLGPDKKPLAVRDAGFNPVTNVAVTDAKPVPRRKVVVRENCNQCHRDIGNPAGLSIHGGSRRNTEYCILCHNPNATDEAQRPADKGTPTSIQFKYLIHRIHTGEQGSNPFVVYGFGGRLIDFYEVRYPGEGADCGKCHDKNTYLLPLPEGALPMNVTLKGQVVSTTQPVAAVCTGCHDSTPTKGHTALNTTQENTETCTVCHAEGREFEVSKVHSRERRRFVNETGTNHCRSEAKAVFAQQTFWKA